MNLLSLPSRSAASLPLTPFERSLLRALKSAFLAALVAVSPALSAYLNNQAIDWQTTLHLAVAGAAFSLLSALQKYFSAQGDAPVAAVAAAAASDPALAAGNYLQFAKDVAKAALAEAVPTGGVVPPSAPDLTAPLAPVASSDAAPVAPAAEEAEEAPASAEEPAA